MSVEEPAGGFNAPDACLAQRQLQLGNESFDDAAVVIRDRFAYADHAAEGYMPAVTFAPAVADTVVWSSTAAAQDHNKQLYTGFSFFFFFLHRTVC